MGREGNFEFFWSVGMKKGTIEKINCPIKSEKGGGAVWGAVPSHTSFSFLPFSPKLQTCQKCQNMGEKKRQTPPHPPSPTNDYVEE